MKQKPAVVLLVVLALMVLTLDLVPSSQAQQDMTRSSDSSADPVQLEIPVSEPAKGNSTVVEEFNSATGFIQTDPDVYIANGLVNWRVSRNGGQQFVYRSIPAFSGDVRLTVRGRVDGWTSNCSVTAGIGSASGPGLSGLAGVTTNFGFYGGGCPTNGPLVWGGGVQLDNSSNGCTFSGNWLWITQYNYYTAVMTLTGNSATLSVPGVGSSSGVRTYNGSYDKLYVGLNSLGDWPECWGAIDSITIEPLGGTTSGRTVLPLVLRAGSGSSITVTPVHRTDSNGNTTIHFSQADLHVTIKDVGGMPLVNARVIAVTDGQKALVIGEDAQNRFYPMFSEVTLGTTADIAEPQAIPIIIPIILLAIDGAISAYSIIEFVEDAPEVIDLHLDYIDYCVTVEQMANTLGLTTLLTWFVPGDEVISHVAGIVLGGGSELWLEDLVEDYWCAHDLPHPARIRQHNFPDMETSLLEVLGPCTDRPQVPICERDTSTLTGIVANVRTGTVVSGAEVQVQPSGPSSISDSSGRYTIGNVPVGYHTVAASREGYVPSTKLVEVESTITTADFDLSPVGSGAEYRFVLTWDQNPRDLDSHLWLPSGNPFHVYYSSRGGLTAHPYAKLDRDDTDSYGPETVTMIRSYTGTYQYAVYKYAGTGSLTTSNSEVSIYRGDVLLRVVNVPITGSGDWWVVATVDGSTGTVAVQNYITSSSPGPYLQEFDQNKESQSKSLSAYSDLQLE